MSQVAPAAFGPVGFYGKISAERDFVRIHAGAFLRAGLDRWFQEAGEHLPGAWLPGEPACFLLCPAAGAQSFIGVLAPGADAIGRSFPAVVFAALDQPLRKEFSLAHLRFALFFEASARLVARAHALVPAQLAAEVDVLASGLRTGVQPPDVNGLLARSRCSDLASALGKLPEAAAYALATFGAACAQADAAGSSARVLVLDCPAASDELQVFWLELVRRRLPAHKPSAFWMRASGRLLVALGPAPSPMLGYLAAPERKSSRHWPLRTLDPSARMNALDKLSPTQRQVLAAGDASLADVLHVFAEV